jgi:hypothetical protein
MQSVSRIYINKDRLLFWVDFDHFESSNIFGRNWGNIKNWLEPKTEPPLGNLSCPNL